MTHPDDEPVMLDFTTDELREWLTSGAGTSLTAEQLTAPELPDDVPPPADTPISVMRNVRMPWDIDRAPSRSRIAAVDSLAA